MKNIIYISIFFQLFAFSAMAQTTDSLNINELYYSALGGNVSSIITKLDSTKDSELNETQLKFKNKFYHRFKSQDEELAYKTTDSLMINIIKIYQDYWKNTLLNRLPLDQADALFTNELTDYIWQAYYKDRGANKDSINADVTTYTKDLLNTRGFNAANGRTGSYYDLLVWSKENKVDYKVDLPETKTDVIVIFMEDIVTMGWEEFAIFGTYYPGGWATSDALYCVGSTYDLNSESFKISYLQHEGQHFADYKVYPKLSGADLEYRAKLVELIYTKERMYPLINFFIGNSSNESRSNSHGFANYCMMRDLSKAIFKTDMEKDMEKWKKISVADINAASLKLFKQNTINLNKIGKDVEEYVK